MLLTDSSQIVGTSERQYRPAILTIKISKSGVPFSRTRSWQERMERLATEYPDPVPGASERDFNTFEYLEDFPDLEVLEQQIPLTAEIIHVVPSQPLGSFLTGTLNFTGRKARWLIELGDADMSAVLAQLGLARPVESKQ